MSTIKNIPAYVIATKIKNIDKNSDKKSWWMVLAGADGLEHVLSVYNTDPTGWVSRDIVYRVYYKELTVSPKCTKTYKILVGEPQALSRTGCPTLRQKHQIAAYHEYLTGWLADKYGIAALKIPGIYDGIERVKNAHLDDQSRWGKYDREEVWIRAQLLKADISNFGPGAGKWVRTEGQADEPPDDSFMSVEDLMNQVTRDYRVKPSHLTTSGSVEPSQLSRICDKYVPIETQKAGISAFVDSMALQVALRERHYMEIFLYFRLIWWLRRHRKYPQFTVKDAMRGISEVLTGRAKKCPRAVLKRLVTAGLVKAPKRISHANKLADDMPLSIRSQQSYVDKHEAAWVARQRAANGRSSNRKHLNRLVDKINNKYQRIEHTDERGHRLDFDTQNQVDAAVPPYFDIWSNKTLKLDLGFSLVVNGGKYAQRAWLYEAVASSWDRPVCRTRIMQNLLLTRDQQQHYERQSKFMWKMHNFLEIPDDMWNQLSDGARQVINDLHHQRGKFWKSKSGVYYRQEGNSFKSDRFKWRSSGGATRCRLSPSLVRPWRACRPVFPSQIVCAGNTVVTDAARFRPIDSPQADGQPAKTYACRKTETQTHRYFAIRREAVACPSTNPQAWRDFDPLIQLDKRNADLLVPMNRSFERSLPLDLPHVQRGALATYQTDADPFRFSKANRYQAFSLKVWATREGI